MQALSRCTPILCNDFPRKSLCEFLTPLFRAKAATETVTKIPWRREAVGEGKRRKGWKDCTKEYYDSLNKEKEEIVEVKKEVKKRGRPKAKTKRK